MKYRYLIPLFLAAFLLQITAVGHIRILGTGPSLILCCVMIDSYFYSSYRGCVLGILMGLLQDLCFAPFIGPNAIAYGLVGFLIKNFKGGVYRDNILSFFLLSLAGTVLWLFSVWGIFALFGQIQSVLLPLKELPILLGYHFIVIMLYYFLVVRRREMRRQARYR